MSARLTILVIVLIAAFFVALGTAFTVHQTQQALVLQFGEPRRVITEPGLHFKVPFIQNVSYYDSRVSILIRKVRICRWWTNGVSTWIPLRAIRLLIR